MGGVTQKAVRLGIAAISLSFVALLGPDAQAGEDVPAAGTFRIGIMGDLIDSDMTLILEAIDDSMAEIGVRAQPVAA
jgi:aspartate aminotransferase-like enzyme